MRKKMEVLHNLCARSSRGAAPCLPAVNGKHASCGSRPPESEQRSLLGLRHVPRLAPAQAIPVSLAACGSSERALAARRFGSSRCSRSPIHRPPRSPSYFATVDEACGASRRAGPGPSLRSIPPHTPRLFLDAPQAPSPFVAGRRTQGNGGNGGKHRRLSRNRMTPGLRI